MAQKNFSLPKAKLIHFTTFISYKIYQCNKIKTTVHIYKNNNVIQLQNCLHVVL